MYSRMVFFAALASSAVFANPVIYTMTSTASGTLAGTAFSNAAITVTSIADTSQVFSFPSGIYTDYEVIADSSTIDIAGFAPATFSDQTFWEDPNGAGDIIFGDFAIGNGILGLTHLFVGLETYNLESSFGPVSSSYDFETSAFNYFQNIPTSEGSLSLVASNDTFTAVVSNVPEPAYPVVIGFGLLGLFAIRRRVLGDRSR
jgi:hypothetical protein